MDKEWKCTPYIPFGEDDTEWKLYDPDVDCLPEEFRPIKYKTNIMRNL